MSIYHKLPPQDSPLRDRYDDAHLVAIATGEADPVWGLAEAKRMARKAFAENPAVKRLYYIVMEYDDRLSLISIGPRGGHRRLWTFGLGRRGLLPWD
jgi:hypothetical protein